MINIQAQIDSCEQAGGGIVYIPAGVYEVGNLRIQTHNITIRGDGPATVLVGNTEDWVFDVGSKDKTLWRVDIEDLAISGNCGGAIHFDSVNQSLIRNVHVLSRPEGRPEFGIRIISSEQVILSQLQIQQCSKSGFTATDSTDLYINNSRSDANGKHGWYFGMCYGIYASNISAWNNSGSGMYEYGGKYHFHSNSVADTSGSSNWVMDGLEDSVIGTGCWASTQQDGSPDWPNGFHLVNAKDIQFIGCMAHNNNGHGLYIGPNCSQIQRIGGSFQRNKKGAIFRDS